jgi:hypothetical protein
MAAFPAITVVDDVGTEYRYTSGGSFGHETATRGDMMFRPAPPPAASILTIAHRDASVAVRLTAELR